jgi:hypothetical protein
MKVFKILKVITFVLLFVAIGGLVVMNLWNWLIPAIFGLKVISFTQALGLLVLSKILFGGFGRGGGWGGNKMHFWKDKMMERMKNMSPEDRERMKAKWGGHWRESAWKEEKSDNQ